MAYRIHRAVADRDLRQMYERSFNRKYHAPYRGFISTFLPDDISIAEVVQRDQIAFIKRTCFCSTQFCLMRTDTKSDADVVTQFAYVGASFAADCEEHIFTNNLFDSEIINSSHPKIPFDRRLDWRALVDASCELCAHLPDPVLRNRVVQVHEAHILLWSKKQRFHDFCGVSKQDREHACDFRVKRPAVSCTGDIQYPFDP